MVLIRLSLNSGSYFIGSSFQSNRGKLYFNGLLSCTQLRGIVAPSSVTKQLEYTQLLKEPIQIARENT